MELRWSRPAAEDLERICAWIERDNPEAARRVAKIIYDGCGPLKDFPHMGRASRRMHGRRELAFPPLPYIVVYQVKESAVEISRIFHEAQDRPLGPRRRTACFRKHLSLREARAVYADFEEDEAAGLWPGVDLPAGAFDLCAELVRRYGARLGVRTLDSLHVASVTELRVERFWTFDERQRRLAAAEGLKIA